jgi:hypothetical protein
MFHKNSPVRIFAFSVVSTLAILLAVLLGIGPSALLITLVLVVVEITFSFDNAIINAKLLAKVSVFWQTMFLSVGIIVAIFGMRVLFPIVIVSLTAHLGWHEVLNLALHHPKEYAHHLELAHPAISAFGGGFLLMLALQFFFDDKREVRWFQQLESRLQRITHWSGAPLVAAVIILTFAVVPLNHHLVGTLLSGGLGVLTYGSIQLIVHGLERWQSTTVTAGVVTKQIGLAALTTLIYLEVLDASFSFDGVIGAFAITSDVILIAAGLGIGALWVRSLTVFMVRRETLGEFIYLEHGAHYTVLALALILLAGIAINISDFIPGLLGIVIIGSSIAASIQARRARVD